MSVGDPNATESGRKLPPDFHTAMAHFYRGEMNRLTGLARPPRHHHQLGHPPHHGHDDLHPRFGEDAALRPVAWAERCEYRHDPGFGVELALRKDLVEGEVVEDLNQLRVGYLQSGLVVGKQIFVVPVGRFADFHGAAGCCCLR